MPEVFCLILHLICTMSSFDSQGHSHTEITGNIIRCCLLVHSTLKSGFQELIYQRALEIEMNLAGMSFSREHKMPIFYHEEQIGTRRVDFLVEGIISVELKATSRLEMIHFNQAINYLEAYNLEIGLLINFGEASLKVHRFKNKKFKPGREYKR